MTTNSAPAGTPRSNIVGLLDENRHLLNSSLHGLSSHQMTAPIAGDWSIKDILTHITSWEELVLLDLNRLKLGREAGLACLVQEATDKWNDLLMSVRRHYPIDQVLSELTETRDTIMRLLNEVTDDKFVSGHVPGSCQVSAFHDWEHAQQIREWRQKEGI